MKKTAQGIDGRKARRIVRKAIKVIRQLVKGAHIEKRDATYWRTFESKEDRSSGCKLR